MPEKTGERNEAGQGQIDHIIKSPEFQKAIARVITEALKEERIAELQAASHSA